MGVATRALTLTYLARWPYRIGQLLRGFRTAVDPGDARAIAELLSPAELDLFLAMRPRDRRHAVETMHHVDRIAREHGTEAPAELRVAGLMHDIGKGQLRVEDRILYVILRALSLELVDRITATHGARWRLALWQLRHHASVGAARLEGVGERAPGDRTDRGAPRYGEWHGRRRAELAAGGG